MISPMRVHGRLLTRSLLSKNSKSRIQFLTGSTFNRLLIRSLLSNKSVSTGSFRHKSGVSSSGNGEKEECPRTPIQLSSAGAPIDLPGEQRAQGKGKVSSNLILYKSDGIKTSILPEGERPLVLLFQWLYAQPHCVQKYCALYHDIGLDVLSVRSKLSHFLWPPVGVQLASELFKYLKDNRPAKERILIHAFSVGAYNYTQAMEAAEKSLEESVKFRERIIGQIFDSIVIGSYEDMSQGIAHVLPNNKAFRQVVLQTLNVYYSVTQSATKDTYDKLVQHFKEAPIPVPTVVFYAENDPMCDVAAMEAMLSKWKTAHPRFEVTKVSWSDSKHAEHLKEHREMYIAVWKGLMGKLRLI